MSQNLVPTKFPALYRHDILEWRRERLNLTKVEIGRELGMGDTRIYRVFAGKVTSKQLWPVANFLKLDWAALHNLKLKESDFHLAVNGAKAR